MKKLGQVIKFLSIIILINIVLFFTIGIGSIFYGPFSNIKEMVVTSAMTTLNHQYIAKLFLSEAEIQKIVSKNKVEDQGKFTKAEDISVLSPSVETKMGEKKKETKIIDISSSKFKGYLLIVEDPKKVKVGTLDVLSGKGMKLVDLLKKYNGVGGINGGGFADENGVGTGGVPLGLVIENGKVLFGKEKEVYPMIGLNEDSVLILGQYTLAEIKQKKIRDAVSFAPFLIVNGEPTIKEGNGGWGIAPRTAIGQRKDGAIVMLVIDGRQVGSIGATLVEVQDVLLKYEVYNAANLDGGASSTMVYKGDIVNKPSSQYGPREIPSAFIIQQ